MNKYLLLFLLLFSVNASSALIKWVDEKGQIHYSDVAPPPDASTKILRSTSKSKGSNSADDSATPSTSDEPKTIAERAAELTKAQQAKNEAADKAAKKQAEAEAKDTYCAAQQQNLRTLQQGVRMMEIDAKGNQSFLEDEQRQQRITKIQQDISSNCK